MKQFAEKREREKEVLQKAIEESCNFSKVTQEKINQRMEANKESRNAQMAALTEKFKARVSCYWHVDLFMCLLLKRWKLQHCDYSVFNTDRTRSSKKRRNWGNERSGKLICSWSEKKKNVTSPKISCLFFHGITCCVRCDSWLYNVRLCVDDFSSLVGFLLAADYIMFFVVVLVKHIAKQLLFVDFSLAFPSIIALRPPFSGWPVIL